MFTYGTFAIAISDCDQPTMVTSYHVNGPLGLAAEVSVCVDQQFGTNFHRICEARTLENSLNVVLRAGHLSVRTAGGTSEVPPYKCTYLLTYLPVIWFCV